MNHKNYFENIYNDFFGVEEIPRIDVNNKEEVELTKDELMSQLFQSINDSYLEEDSKNLLKQIIEYMRKYQEKIETNYISFHLILQLQNKNLEKDIINFIKEAVKTFSYTEKNNTKELSFYQTNLKVEEAFKENGIIVLKDIKGIELLDTKDKRVLFHSIEECLQNYPKSVVILSTNNKEEQTFFFQESMNIKESEFSFILKEKEMTSLDVYSKISEKIELKEEEQVKLLDYINATFNTSKENFEEYSTSLTNYISFHKTIPEMPKEKTLDEIFASLNELVGLKKVKTVLYELADMMKLKEKAKENLKLNNLNLHMVFLGNPGTGKTTVARIVAGILYNLGYLQENKLIEVSAKDLVAEYVGQTSPKTSAVIEKSLGGVLFIDEAYSLAAKESNSYNAEAIATLIQAMENYRDKLVVIFAGYTKEMQEFLNSNSGIVSRIGYTLEFDDYTEDELVEIFKGMINKSGFILNDEAENKVRSIIKENLGKPNFGNARFIRNIYEKSIVKHASNVKDKKRMSILKTITAQDINTDNLIL